MHGCVGIVVTAFGDALLGMERKQRWRIHFDKKIPDGNLIDQKLTVEVSGFDY